MIKQLPLLILVSILIVRCNTPQAEEETKVECSTSMQVIESSYNTENQILVLESSSTSGYKAVLDEYFETSLNKTIDSLKMGLELKDIHYEAKLIANTDILQIDLSTKKPCDCPRLLNTTLDVLISDSFEHQLSVYTKEAESIDNELKFIQEQMEMLSSEISQPSPYANGLSKEEVYKEAMVNLNLLEKKYTQFLEIKLNNEIQSTGIVPCFIILEPAI